MKLSLSIFFNIYLIFLLNRRFVKTKEEGRRKKEEGRKKKEEGRRKKEEEIYGKFLNDRNFTLN
ncbi:hypothetical protein QT970_05955 [Microcoleus sp. herbarium8]|uniref:hypothetical protein n=1 Tax=Microcoleus sp. herbarium8 TaxID=3055436 RepID=UPI002FD09E11